MVYVSGATGNRPNIALADADSATTMPAVGMTMATIANNAYGMILVHGVFTGIDLSAYATGDELFVSGTPGGTTNVKPTFPQRDQSVGIVLNAAVNGTIYFNGTGEDLHLESITDGTNNYNDHPRRLSFNSDHFYLSGDQYGEPVVNLRGGFVPVKLFNLPTITNTLAETDLLNLSIPAGSLGTDKALKFKITGRAYNFSGVNRTMTVKGYYGAKTMFNVTTAAITFVDKVRTFKFWGNLQALGNSQTKFFDSEFQIGGTSAATAGITKANVALDAGFQSKEPFTVDDSLAGQTFRLTLAPAAASPAYTFYLDYAVVEVE
jgi:hypothetical protein